MCVRGLREIGTGWSMSLMHINEPAAVHLQSGKEHNHLASSTTNSMYNLSHTRFPSECIVVSSATPGVNERNYTDYTDLLYTVTHACVKQAYVWRRRGFALYIGQKTHYTEEILTTVKEIPCAGGLPRSYGDSGRSSVYGVSYISLQLRQNQRLCCVPLVK
jgi:hypothetical protein